MAAGNDGRCRFERPCATCGSTFEARGNRAKYCSLTCRNWARKHPGEPMPTPTCKTCGTATPGLKFKYCSPECRTVTRPGGRAPTAPLAIRQRTLRCGYCGTTFETARSTAKYCSKACSDRGDSTPGTYQARQGRRCEYCGGQIPDTHRLNRRFCTESHQVMHNQGIRRARRRSLPSEHIDLASVLDRCGGKCHICGQSLGDDRHLDHIIPLAAEGSPGHVWENVAFAHPHCNIGKNARATERDWALYHTLRALRGQGGDEEWQTSSPETATQND